MNLGAIAPIAIQLSTTGRAVGLVSRVVTRSPGAGEHLFAVQQNSGHILALAHDAFEAARLFIDIEDRIDPWPTGAVTRLDTDAEISRDDENERFDEHARGYYVMLLDHQREILAAVRAGFVTKLARRAAKGETP